MRKKWIRVTIATALMGISILYYFALPDPVFNDPYSTVLLDRNGRLLSATIAADGQWRFPELSVVPEKFKRAIVAFEDKRFRHHPGVDVLSLARAARQNWRAGKIVSGGSTLSMQVIRLSRKGQPRTILEKLFEMLLATRLEWRYSKDEILAMYASHAPFGGNVVGIEAACWRYFGRDWQDISWSDAALLAVLPNNPALLHPGRNRARLQSKRNRLLTRLAAAGIMDALSDELAQAEPLPDAPLPLPTDARHLLDRAMKEGHSQTRIHSTLDGVLQQRVEQILADHHQRLKANQIFNGAVLVLNVKTGAVLAYAGNTVAGSANQDQVDMIAARRSTGSILKPFLFAAMVNDGKLLGKTLMPDIPMNLQGFIPKNFSHQYDGAVPADKALIRSLNIPFVWGLRQYRYEKFHELLTSIGITTLNKPPAHYGLALILGGAEGTLWDITGTYASMARTLNNYFDHPGSRRYNRKDFHAPVYQAASSEKSDDRVLEETSLLNASSIWLTFDALKELYRPGEETGWRHFNSAKKIAWKTGTSVGFRDGWAVGVNPDFAVGVWIGNADGEGRPGLLGTETAAPVLFDIFSQLPGQSWFRQPKPEMEKITVCSLSGQRAGSRCVDIDTTLVPQAGLQTVSCQYHKNINVTLDEKFRVHSDCSPMDQLKSISWFVLPPVQEYYYRARNITYRALPPFREDCLNPSTLVSMDVIYPKPNARIFIPRELDGQQGKAIFEVAHRTPTATVYWHLDGNFIGSTRKSHYLALAPPGGQHVLTLVDEFGESMERTFTIVSGQ